MSTAARVPMSGKSKKVSSQLNQVIDVIQEDISGSATRRKYQTFVTGGIGPGVTSSLYQTVYDQDFTLQTANPVLDMSVGLFHYDNGTTKRDNLVTAGTGYSKSDTTNQLSFDTRSTMMMREKINVYRQYAQYLLGDANAAFSLNRDNGVLAVSSSNISATAGETEGSKIAGDNSIIDAALFINVKRLFNRDGIRKETFALRLYKNAPRWDTTIAYSDYVYHYDTAGVIDNTASSQTLAPKNNILGDLVESSEDGVQIIADIQANTAGNYKQDTRAGEVALLKLASDATQVVGLLFYEAGIAVLNLGGSSITTTLEYAASVDSNNEKVIDLGIGQTDGIATIFEPRDPMYGIIAGMDDGVGSDDGSLGAKETGQVYVGAGTMATSGLSVSNRTVTNTGPSTFYPDLLVSASIDDIVDHIGYTRFSSGSLTGMAFQNSTKIESTIYFCRAEANQFNVSNNATWKKDGVNNSQGVMIQNAETDTAFTYITTVLLYDDSPENGPVAVAKLNRPIEKNEESEVTIRVRLDF